MFEIDFLVINININDFYNQYIILSIIPNDLLVIM